MSNCCASYTTKWVLLQFDIYMYQVLGRSLHRSYSWWSHLSICAFCMETITLQSIVSIHCCSETAPKPCTWKVDFSFIVHLTCRVIFLLFKFLILWFENTPSGIVCTTIPQLKDIIHGYYIYIMNMWKFMNL